MPAFLISLLPILAQAAPSIIGLLGGAGAERIAGRVAAAARDVFGTDDPAAIKAQVAADPAKADALRARLDAETEQLKAELADVENARAASLALAQAGSSSAWGPSAVSVLVVGGFIGMMTYLLTARVDFNEATGQVVLLLTGTFSAGFTQVLNYWLGSSVGSRDKTEQIGTLLHQARAPAAKPKRA